MRRAVFVWLPFLMLFSADHVFSQTRAKDSLLALIKTLPEDTSKLDAYFGYGFIMENHDLDSAAYYYRKAHDISQKFDYVPGRVRFVHNYSYVLNLQGKLDEANALNKAGLRLAREHHMELDIAKALANLGSNYNHKGQYDSAMTCYLEAIALFENLNLTSYLVTLYQNIGVAFDATEQFDRAIEYGLKAWEYGKLNGDSIAMASALVNIGGSLSSIHLYDSALKLFESALMISNQTGYASGSHAAFIGIGNIRSAKNDTRLAVEAFREALAVARRMNYPGGAANALNGLAMSMSREGNLAEADQYATEAIHISEKAESGVFTDLRQQYKLLADVKAKRNRLQEAYHYLEKYVILNDSLSGADIQKMTANLERKYQLARKEQEIAQRDLRLEQVENNVRRKNALLAVVMVSLVLLTVLMILLYRYFRQRQRLQQQEVNALQQQQEVVRLKSTLEGQQQERMRIAKEIHDDIGSGLTSLVFLSNTLPDNGAAHGVKEKISGIARQMVSQMNEIVWSLNSEQDTLEDLVIYARHSIGEMLETVNMAYEFSIPPVIPSVYLSGAERRHLFLVLKEAVHNSVKHARATRISIAMTFSDAICFTIEDNGQGVAGEKRFGNGLRNMQFRMNEIGGTWALAATKPVKIVVTLPLPKSV